MQCWPSWRQSKLSSRHWFQVKLPRWARSDDAMPNLAGPLLAIRAALQYATTLCPAGSNRSRPISRVHGRPPASVLSQRASTMLVVWLAWMAFSPLPVKIQDAGAHTASAAGRPVGCQTGAHLPQASIRSTKTQVTGTGMFIYTGGAWPSSLIFGPEVSA